MAVLKHYLISYLPKSLFPGIPNCGPTMVGGVWKASRKHTKIDTLKKHQKTTPGLQNDSNIDAPELQNASPKRSLAPCATKKCQHWFRPIIYYVLGTSPTLETLWFPLLFASKTTPKRMTERVPSKNMKKVSLGPKNIKKWMTPFAGNAKKALQKCMVCFPLRLLVFSMDSDP